MCFVNPVQALHTYDTVMQVNSYSFRMDENKDGNLTEEEFLKGCLQDDELSKMLAPNVATQILVQFPFSLTDGVAAQQQRI